MIKAFGFHGRFPQWLIPPHVKETVQVMKNSCASCTQGPKESWPIRRVSYSCWLTFAKAGNQTHASVTHVGTFVGTKVLQSCILEVIAITRPDNYAVSQKKKKSNELELLVKPLVDTGNRRWFKHQLQMPHVAAASLFEGCGVCHCLNVRVKLTWTLLVRRHSQGKRWLGLFSADTGVKTQLSYRWAVSLCGLYL